MIKYDIEEAHNKIKELETDNALLEDKIAGLEALLKKAEETVIRQQKEIACIQQHFRIEL